MRYGPTNYDQHSDTSSSNLAATCSHSWKITSAFPENYDYRGRLRPLPRSDCGWFWSGEILRLERDDHRAVLWYFVSFDFRLDFILCADVVLSSPQSTGPLILLTTDFCWVNLTYVDFEIPYGMCSRVNPVLHQFSIPVWNHMLICL